MNKTLSTRAASAVFFSLFALFFWASCSGGGGSNSGECEPEAGCTVCGQIGSSIEGTCLEVKPNALSEKTTFTLSAINDIIGAPSLTIGDAVQISPADVEFLIDATLTVSYDDNGVSSLFVTSDDAALFGETSDNTFIIGSGGLEIDTAGQRIMAPISETGSFQPGFQVIGPISVGDRSDIGMGGSKGSIAIDMDPGEEYVFFVTAMPDGFLTSPDTVSSIESPVTIQASIASQGLGKQTKGSGEGADDPPPPPSPQEVLKEKLFDRVRALELQGKTGHLKKRSKGVIPTPSFKAGSGLDWVIGDGSNVNDEAQDIRMLDVSDSDGDLSTTDTVTFDGVVRAVSSDGKYVIVIDKADGNPTVTGGSELVADLVKDAIDNQIASRLLFFFGDNSDVDGNGRTEIIVTSKIFGGILGFYDAANVFEFKSGTSTDESNEADVVFATIPSLSQVSLLESTVGHELQHLVNFNRKTLTRLVSGPGEVGDPDSIPASTPFEDPFVNEGMSYMNEELNGYGELTAGPLPLTKNYTEPGAGGYNGPSDTALLDNSGQVSNRVRGANFLFQWYLYNIAGGAVQNSSNGSYTDTGGAAFLKELTASADVGIQNYINTILQFSSNGADFEDFFKDYMVTLYNDNQSSPPSEEESLQFPPKYADFFTGSEVGISMFEDISNGPTLNEFTAGEKLFSSEVATLGVLMVLYRSNVDNLVKFTLFDQNAENDPSVEPVGNNQAIVLRAK